MKFLHKIWACIALQPNLCHAFWRMIKNRIELTWVKSFWTKLMVMITFWKTLLQEEGHGCTDTMSKWKSNHRSGCQKCRRDQKKHAKCIHTSRWCWRYFFILRVLFAMSFYHKAGQSIRSIIWKLCNVFMRQSGKKDWCVAGESMDAPTWQCALTFIVPCPWLLGQTCNDCPSTASILSRSRTSWLLFPKLKSTLKGRRFESIEAIKKNSLAHLRSIPKTAFQECFRTWRNAGSGAYRVEGSTLKATRLNSFKVRMENFYAIYSGIFRTDLVYRSSCKVPVILVRF